jgi:hypothetical protein
MRVTPTAGQRKEDIMTRTHLTWNRFVAAIGIPLVAGCAEIPTGSAGEPRLLINGTDDFDRTAVAAVMVYDPNHPNSPGWRSFCTATLVHKRVLTTAGHCVQFIEAQLAAGRIRAVWISFQQDPLAHFNTPPTVADPATGGWYEVESLHDNPANPDFSDFDHYLAIHPDFHDSGAIMLKERVTGIQPMKLPARPGEVEALLGRAGCESGADCGLVGVGYGLREFPPPFNPTQARQSAPMLYEGVNSLWVRTFQAAAGSAFGGMCFGDSGGPVILQKDNGRDRIVVGMISDVDDPATFSSCTDPGNVALHYRVDTAVHLSFINDVILQSLRGGSNWRPLQ